ncbi:MAG: FHA domain-containing protein [Xenococcus sp. MO_188.B8]|nr:FHA domain-containing protein [Xenococcus sp. MO_188.B8]
MPEIIVVNLKKPQERNILKIAPQKQGNQECILGRSERCCIVLDDVMISRFHGKIAFADGTYYYRDLGSRNGSRINNKRVEINQNYPLNSSDIIAVGNHLLLIKGILKSSAVRGMYRSGLSIVPHSVAAQLDTAIAITNELPLNRKGELQVNCVQVIRETHNVRTFRFIGNDPISYTYKPGQFITVSLNIGGKSVQRCYFISSTPSRPYTLDITVKLVPFLGENALPGALAQKIPKSSDIPNPIAGLVNNWVYKNLQVGSRITISQPRGEFPNFVNSSGKILLISAGIGIAPMMSIARWLCDTVSNVDIIFVHSARSPRDIIFRKELELMSQKFPNFKLAITVTRTKTGTSWYGYTGRLNKSILPVIAPDYRERNVYVCGSDSFRKAMRSLMEELSLPMKNYYGEALDISQIVKQNQPQVNSIEKVKPITSQAKSLTIVTQTSQNSNTLTIEPKKIVSVLSSTKVPAAAVTTPVKSYAQACSKLKQREMEKQVELRDSGEQEQKRNRKFHGGQALKSESSKTKMPIVFFTKSEKEITCDGEKSILDLALAKNIALPYGCGMGVCGQCKLKKISGKVVYDDDDIPCEDSHVLTCIAKAEGKVVIEG